MTDNANPRFRQLNIVILLLFAYGVFTLYTSVRLLMMPMPKSIQSKIELCEKFPPQGRAAAQCERAKKDFKNKDRFAIGLIVSSLVILGLTAGLLARNNLCRLVLIGLLILGVIPKILELRHLTLQMSKTPDMQKAIYAGMTSAGYFIVLLVYSVYVLSKKDIASQFKRNKQIPPNEDS